MGRYFGPDVATQTAAHMEYQGQGWRDQNSNQIYGRPLLSTAAHPLRPVCQMEVDARTAPRTVYRGTTYYF